MILIFIGKSASRRSSEAEELKWEDLAMDELATLASTPTLFGGARTFVLARVFYSDRGDEFLDAADMFAASPHTFIFEEEKLLKHETDVLNKVGAKIEINKAEKKEFRFDQYGVATALGNKDKKGLWLGLTQALRAGEKAEALAGLLAWKARAMRDAKLSRELTFMYHDSHRGAGDLELLLEGFALKL